MPRAVPDAVLALQSALTDRDHRLLGWLYDHGVMTTDQIAHALFPSLDFAQRRLLKLLGYGAIARFRPQRPDGGSYPYHYVIDQLGADVVAAQRRTERPRRDHARTRRHHLTSKANLPHLLGVNQFFTDLAGYARTHPDAELVRWWPASRFHHRGAFLHPGDDPSAMLHPMPRPDGHGIWTEHGATVAFWLEYDLATEPLDVLLGKIDRYHRLSAAVRRGWPLLFWLPRARRELHLHQLLVDVTDLAMPVATMTGEHTTTTGLSPAEAVWWLHGHVGGRVRLADLLTAG